MPVIYIGDTPTYGSNGLCDFMTLLSLESLFNFH